MVRQGHIKVVLPKDEGEPVTVAQDIDSQILDLPDRAVLDAGVRKFLEYANLHWPLSRPTADEAFKLTSFDYRNDYHLRVTLGMVFLAMRQVEEAE